MTSTVPDTRPLDLVTGASSGVGLELVRQFAENGFDLLVNAEDDGIRAAAAQLGSTGVRVEPVQADPRTGDGVHRLTSAITATGRPLSAAALNAGVGQGGPFVENDLADEQSIIDLYIASTVHLAKHVLHDMVARDEGKVLITSSIASMHPGSLQAVSNASKSFPQSFAQAGRAS